MGRKLGGALVVVVAVLVCSACGGLLLNGIPSGSSPHVGTVMTSMTVTTPMQVVQPFPLSRIGTGTESLGTFAVHGNVRVRATCIGTGKLEIDFAGSNGSDGMGGVRCLGDNTLAVNGESNLGAEGGPVQITVHAPAHMKWWLDVVDRQPNF